MDIWNHDAEEPLPVMASMALQAFYFCSDLAVGSCSK